MASMGLEDMTDWPQPPGNPHTLPDGPEPHVSGSYHGAETEWLQSQIEHLPPHPAYANEGPEGNISLTKMLFASLRARDKTIAAQQEELDTYRTLYGRLPAADTGSGEQTTMPLDGLHPNTSDTHLTSHTHAASSSAPAPVDPVQPPQGLGGMTMSPQEWAQLYRQSSQGNSATSQNPGHPGG
ncbi:hypothetical protein L204_106215 [Cryptococcus depauperatus]